MNSELTDVGSLITDHKSQNKTFTIELETRKSSKSVRGMPRLSEARKDVTSCDKLRGGANSH